MPALEPFPGTRIVSLIHEEILLKALKPLVDTDKAFALEAMTSSRLQQN